MLDGYFAAACVGLLIALAIAASIIRHQSKEISRAWQCNSDLAAENGGLEFDVRQLKRELAQARKNDNRDTKGRYAKATA